MTEFNSRANEGAGSSASDAWDEDLRRLIDGQRDAELRRIGSVEDYIETKIANSDDPVLARKAFVTALERVVRGWGPTRAEMSGALSRLLDLVTAYTPAIGLTKLLSLFATDGKLSGVPQGMPEEVVDLHLKGLVALAAYFPAAPVTKRAENAFSAYTTILRNHLDEPDYRRHAAIRLYELDRLPFDQRSERLCDDPSVLTDLLRKIAEEPQSAAARVSWIYARALKSEAADAAFRTALVRNEGRLIHRRGFPFVSIGGYELPLVVADMDAYTAQHWVEQARNGPNIIRDAVRRFATTRPSE